MSKPPLSYGDYLKLDELLGCQQPESVRQGRIAHDEMLMVQRMIGVRIGTGGSVGHEYLRRTTEEHRVFGDLFALSSFLIPRSALPPLPDDVRRQMDFAYGNGNERQD